MAATAGHTVLAVDTDDEIVTAINAGFPLSAEPEVAALSAAVARSGRLTASDAPRPGDVFIIAVPTPVDESGRRADLTSVEVATRSIVPHLRSGNLVIVESTVPPGTCMRLVSTILEESGLSVTDDVLLAHCPERVYPGETVEEMTRVDRIIGGISERSTSAAQRFYASFVEGDLIETDILTAEFTKLMENTYRDVNIALTNQIGAIAAHHGIDPNEAIRIANGHPRVSFLAPGIGVGGHCIPVDPWFLITDEDDDGVIGAARRVNEMQPDRVTQLIAEQVDGVDSPRIVLAGAAYKAEVVDTRNAPALRIRSALADRGFDVVTYDPLVPQYGGDLLGMATGADLLVVLVPHRRVTDEIRSQVPSLRSLMRRERIIDLSGGVVREFD
jgi:UDP-N-acetyl-D-mannosaminuronic acid dehydrogenase